MIDLHTVATPNGHKASIMLEEVGLPYNIIPYNIFAGEQFSPTLLAINPNNKLPAIVDHDPIGGGEPYPVFEFWRDSLLFGREDRTASAIGAARPA